MFSRRNHSRRNRSSFSSPGAEVLEQRRLPSNLVNLYFNANDPLGTGESMDGDIDITTADDQSAPPRGATGGDDGGGGIFNDGGTLNAGGSHTGGINVLMGDGSVRF